MIPDFARLFDRPIIILSAPRSGSTLLFETLAEARDAWTIGGESHQIIEGIRSLHPGSGNVESNRLHATHATDEVVRFLRSNFARHLKDREGREFFRNRGIPQLRFLEKTPKNSLRIPFMDRVFPDALYVFLFRDVRANLSSMMEAWKAKRWVTYPNLRGWAGPPWSLLLPPGWQALDGKPLEEICAFQWASANRFILDDLQAVPRERWTAIDYQSLLDEPARVIEHLCNFLQLETDDRLLSRVSKPLPLSRLTHTAPKAEKWRQNEKEIETVLPMLSEVEERLKALGYKRW